MNEKSAFNGPPLLLVSALLFNHVLFESCDLQWFLIPGLLGCSLMCVLVDAIDTFAASGSLSWIYMCAEVCHACRVDPC